MKPEARRFVKLLKFDATRPESAAALRVYRVATLRQASYPNLLGEDIPARMPPTSGCGALPMPIASNCHG